MLKNKKDLQIIGILILAVLVLIITVALIINDSTKTYDIDDVEEIFNEQMKTPTRRATHINDEIRYYLPSDYDLIEDTQNVLLVNEQESLAIQLYYGTGNYLSEELLFEIFSEEQIIYKNITDNGQILEYQLVVTTDDGMYQAIYGQNDRYIVGQADMRDFEEILTDMMLIYNSVEEIQGEL